MLKTTLIECSKSASHQKNTYFYAQYHRISSRRGKNRAAIAVAHTMLTIVYQILKNNSPYYELGADFFEQQRKNQIVQKSVKRLESLGYSVTVEETLPGA
jgi:hypothetical protein